MGKKNLKYRTPNMHLNQGGVVIIFAVLLMGLFLSIALTLSAVFIPKIRVSSNVKNSIGAMYAAESGVEWCLYVNFKTPQSPVPSSPVMINGATYINGNTGQPLVSSDCFTLPIKLIATYKGITRAFEISF